MPVIPKLRRLRIKSWRLAWEIKGDNQKKKYTQKKSQLGLQILMDHNILLKHFIRIFKHIPEEDGAQTPHTRQSASTVLSVARFH